MSINLKEGYFHVGVHKDCQPFMGFRWRDAWYRYRVIPFGFSHSPWVFTKMIRHMIKRWRIRGYFVLAYVDDFLLMAPSPEELIQARDWIAQDLRNHGWHLEMDKSHWEPTQRLEFLGLIIDSQRGILEVPQAKVNNLKSLIREVLPKKEETARNLARVAGTLISVARAFSPARLYTRTVYREFKGYQTRSWDWDTKVTLSQKTKEELTWILNNLDKFNGSAIWRPAIVLQLATDASPTGWGFQFKDISGGSQWSAEEQTLHINELELLGMLRGLQTVQAELRNSSVELVTDSTVARDNWNNQGGSKDNLTFRVRQIWEWAVLNNVTLLNSIWIPGKSNVIPDSESRMTDFHDWTLRRDLFEALDRKWGPHSVDRMASDLNSQTLKFNSIRWCPGTSAVDCFSQDWSLDNNYVLPPANLVLRVLNHINECKASATLIVPQWSSQPWWPLLMKMREEEIVWSEPPSKLFLRGASGIVEPWKNNQWTYMAVRVKSISMVC